MPDFHGYLLTFRPPISNFPLIGEVFVRPWNVFARNAMAAKAATKSAIYQELSTETGLTRKQVGSVFDALSNLIRDHLGKKGAGMVTIPGLLKLKLVKKPATKARMARIQVVADDLALNALLFQRLLPNVRLGWVRRCDKTDDVTRILCEHKSVLPRDGPKEFYCTRAHPMPTP